jgi:DNA polymerase-4
MHKKSGIEWLYLDLNSYFASIEQQENPRLRGKPVAVVPMMTDSTCAIAASYEAKAYGVKTGTPIYEAKKMCPGLRCVPARHGLYVDYHHRVIEEVVLHTPINKIWSIDEISSRLPPNKRSPERAAEVAAKIKKGLRDNVGECITASIGVAPNSLLAKIAADIKKPNGLTIITQETLPGPLLNLPLTDIPGIGANMNIRLKNSGITDMAKLWNLSPKHARKIWGGVQGERLWYWLHGYDFEAPETGNVMIGHSRVLDPALRAPDQARLMARRLLVKAVRRLRSKKFYAQRLYCGARLVSGYKWAAETTLPPTCEPFTFLNALDGMWNEMVKALCPLSEGARFKKVSVILSGLKTANEISLDLFETNTPLNKKREALAAALDTLQNKYQKEIVSLGITPRTSSGDVGTKIAFSRVPEREEFWG